MTAAAEKFMAPLPEKAEALPWLKDAPRGDAPAWVKAVRATGAEVFSSVGLPTTAWEGWRHTNLRGLKAGNFRYGLRCDAGVLPAPLLEGAGRVVVINGQYQPRLSMLPPGIEVTGLMEAQGVEQWLAGMGNLAATPLRALNAAYLRDGFVLTAKGDVATPVEVLFYNSGAAAIYPRVLYRLGKNAGLTVFERHCGAGAYFANGVTETVLEPDSRMKFYRLMQESAAAFHVSGMSVQLQKGAEFEGFSMATGGAVSREEFTLNLVDSVISACVGGV
jgi:Fe-S cluster assembly protein SufD